jgi:hypothetical protein
MKNENLSDNSQEGEGNLTKLAAQRIEERARRSADRYATVLLAFAREALGALVLSSRDRRVSKPYLQETGGGCSIMEAVRETNGWRGKSEISDESWAEVLAEEAIDLAEAAVKVYRLNVEDFYQDEIKRYTAIEEEKK